jgi:hypothetical protein
MAETVMTDARGRTEPPPARHDPPPAPRALIVEDEPALLRALRINLRARGSQVVGAALEPRPQTRLAQLTC